MGTESRYLIFIFFLFSASLSAQESKDFTIVDSITFSYYSSGNWDELIKLGNEAIAKHIDYKYLRQRIGYAFFVKGNFSDAKYNFEKALLFDSYDQFTLEYLYYTYQNTGKDYYTGTIVNKLNPEFKKNLTLRPFKAIESIELEYNYKYAGTLSRSNPQYYRLGISSKIGYRLFLYQSFSNYKQIISSSMNGKSIETFYSQPEYFALLKWNALNKLALRYGYHYFGTTSGTSVSHGNLFLLSAATDFNRFSFEAAGSIIYSASQIVWQAGGSAGYVFPGKSSFTLTSSLSDVIHQTYNHFVYNQTAGLKLTKKIWFEGNIAFGNMSDYNDYGGLYLYNTYDPMVFRTGATAVFYAGNRISFWANFVIEGREYFENNSFQYNQFSYLGGVRWRL